MGMILGWFTGIVLMLSAVVLLHHIGVDVGPMIGVTMHGIERFLGHPL